MRPLTAVLLSLVLAPVAQAAKPAPPVDSLKTVAERSGFVRTGRYDEVDRLCHLFELKFSRQVRCFSFGTTPEGRTMWALAVSGDGSFTPESARQHQRPVILAQGGIHAGEIDGKDAGFLVLREWLTDAAKARELTQVTFVFVPVFNVDGHERFGRWNRPNQVGPEEMGWRTTAQNYNLNRDYTKADAPEMQAMQRLLNEWDPAVYVDLHVTDGAQFRHDVSVQSEPGASGDPEVMTLATAIRDRINGRLAAQGSLPLSFYPSFDVNDDPGSGISDVPAQPRFSTGYWAQSNRVALLIETHSWKDYPTRVRVTANVLRALLDLGSRDAPAWEATLRQADQRATQLAKTTIPLEFKVTGEVRWIDFLGYEYERVPSPVSGALVTHYDTSKPAVWHMALRDHVVVSKEVKAPGVGYVVPPAVATWLLPKLRDHGIRYEPIARSGAEPLEAQAWRASSVSTAAETFEGHNLFTLKGAWADEKVPFVAGSVLVPIAQPKARLVMALLEPEAPDSYATWGFFSTAFEQKEYMEAYVAERVADEMLAKSPELRKEFAQRLAADAAFAANPQARLDFFYRRHSSWDQHYDLYPVYRLDKAP